MRLHQVRAAGPKKTDVKKSPPSTPPALPAPPAHFSPVCSPCVYRAGPVDVGPWPTPRGAGAGCAAGGSELRKAGRSDVPSRVLAGSACKCNLRTPRAPCACSSGPCRRRAVPQAPWSERGPRGVTRRGATGRPRPPPRRLSRGSGAKSAFCAPRGGRGCTLPVRYRFGPCSTHPGASAGRVSGGGAVRKVAPGGRQVETFHWAVKSIIKTLGGSDEVFTTRERLFRCPQHTR